ncbi:MAG: hypothetical protein WDN69_31015 [Aliidongia sp.]
MKGLLPPHEGPHDRTEENAARLAAAQAAITAMEESLRLIAEVQVDTKLYIQSGARVIEQYRRQITARSKPDMAVAQANEIEEIERNLRIVGLRAEREEYFRIARSGKLPDELARTLVREIDLTEARLATK